MPWVDYFLAPRTDNEEKCPTNVQGGMGTAGID